MGLAKKEGSEKLRPSDESGPGEGSMGSEEYRLLRDLVNYWSGLHYAEDARFGFERKIRERMQALGLATFMEYYWHIQEEGKGEAELQELYDLLVTKETYFFREEYQLVAFRDELLPSLMRDVGDRRQLTVWSAGCSTGEEAYSVAIILMESGRLDGWTLRVHGTDLSRRSLSIARKGLYSEASFRATSAERRSKYFVEAEGGCRVNDSLRGICHFGLMNLLQMHRSPQIIQPDVVFCKNVLIYFDPTSRRRVLDGLFERLRPGGYLLLGHSESLLNEATRFEAVHLQGDVVYRKPLSQSMAPLAGLRRRGVR